MIGNNLKPWYASDIAQLLRCVYFTHRTASNNIEFTRGVVITLAAIATAIGFDPGTVMQDRDVETFVLPELKAPDGVTKA